MDQPESEHDKEKIDRLRRAMYSRELGGKLGARPRHELDSVQPIVGEDWQRTEKELPRSIVAPRAIALMRYVLWWTLGLAVVFFLGASGFFVYYFTFGGGSSPASPANIDIAISGPPQIPGGDPTQLQIIVTNRNQVPLQLADLVITYPPGTRSPTDLSTDLSTQRIALGNIEAGGRRQGTVSAIFAGSGGSAAVKIDLEYRLAGSSAIFVASSNYQAALSSSPITVSIDGKNETVSGQPTEFTITVLSNANTIVRDVLLSASYPFGFTLRSANPKPFGDQSTGTAGNLWELGDIPPGQKRTITIRGSLVGESGDERIFRFSAGLRKSGDDKDITTPLSENTLKMKVSEPFLGLGVSVNKSTGSNVVVSPGTNVSVTISWQNNLSTLIQDAVIIARLSGVQIDGSTVISPDGFFRSSDGVVLWDKNTSRGLLGSLSAGAKGTVSFTFQMPSSDALKNVRNPSLTISVNAAGKRVSEEGVPENLQSTASQRVAIASDVRVTAQGLYYANPFGSSGPIPPKAGQETTYAIVFTLTNTTNKITDGTITATLPPYIRWTGIYSPASEKVYFKGITQSSSNPDTVCQNAGADFCWDLGELDAGVGMNGGNPRQAAVAVGFTPSTSQIGQEPPLLQDITFTGKDASTGKTITKYIDNVTTNIVGDPGFSAGNAAVVK